MLISFTRCAASVALGLQPQSLAVQMYLDMLPEALKMAEIVRKNRLWTDRKLAPVLPMSKVGLPASPFGRVGYVLRTWFFRGYSFALPRSKTGTSW